MKNQIFFYLHEAECAARLVSGQRFRKRCLEQIQTRLSGFVHTAESAVKLEPTLAKASWETF